MATETDKVEPTDIEQVNGEDVEGVTDMLVEEVTDSTKAARDGGEAEGEAENSQVTDSTKAGGDGEDAEGEAENSQVTDSTKAEGDGGEGGEAEGEAENSQGEVLDRVQWKNNCSNDDTWELEAQLQESRGELLAFKKSIVDAEAKKEEEGKESVTVLPTKSDGFDADPESESNKNHPTEAPEEEPLPKKKKKKKRKKDKWRGLFKPPSTDEEEEEEDEEEKEEERAPTLPSPSKEKNTKSKKRVIDSEEEDDEPVPTKKYKNKKGKERAKHKKKKKQGKRERKTDTSEDEDAPLEEDLSDGLSESQMDDTTSTDDAAKSAKRKTSPNKICGGLSHGTQRAVHTPAQRTGEIEKIPKTSKDSPAKKSETVKTKTKQFNGELQDAVKSGDYMAVKLALNSEEDDYLDQEHTPSLSQPGLSRTSATPQSPVRTANLSSCSSSATPSSCSEDGSNSDQERQFPQHASSSSDSDSSFSESEVVDDTAEEQWLSKNKMISWEPNEENSLQYFPSGRLSEGPTAYAILRISDIQSSMDLFVTEDIIKLVLKYTNLHGRRTDGDRWKEITMIELRAFIGLAILAGVYRSKDEATKSLWSEGTGRAIFSATMACRRFEKIARSLRFDDKLTRAERLRDNKMAAFSPVWNKWASRLQLMYNPGVDITVDEQMVPFKGSCRFRQYIPSKPDRYGIKIWVACDARTSYAWRMSVYTGKQKGAPPEVNQGKRVVLELVEGLRGHTVTCDNFFTSYGLGEELLKKRMGMVGTMRKYKPELPRNLLEIKQRAIRSSLFAFTSTHTAVSYVPKRGKNVVLMSTKHRKPAISGESHRKPMIIMDYNQNKDGVDNLDKLIGTYSCRRKTLRWPLKMFYHILDVSAYNAFVLWMCVDPLWKRGVNYKRRLFLEALGTAMVTPLMQERQPLPQNPSDIALVNAAQKAQLEETNVTPAVAKPLRQRRPCHRCTKKVRAICCKCGKSICRDHSSMICVTCRS